MNLSAFDFYISAARACESAAIVAVTYLLVCGVARIWRAIFDAPEGHEDDGGFHFDDSANEFPDEYGRDSGRDVAEQKQPPTKTTAH